MHKKTEKEAVEVVLVKAIIYSLIIIIIIVFVILAPKRVFNNNRPFLLAASMAITSDDNLILYDYDVYGTDEKFNIGLTNDVQDVKVDFQNRNEILAIKIYGSEDKIEIRDDYIYITSSETPQLNIEYYIVKDMKFNDIILPCRSFIMLFNDFLRLINDIYITLFSVFFISAFAPITIKLTRNITYLVKNRNLY